MAVYWPRSFVLRTWSISRHLDQILLIFATIISVILSITLIGHPPPVPPPHLPCSSIKPAPLNKARILKYPRKCDESPLFYSLEKNVMEYIRLCLVLDGRLYADPESLECKCKNPNNFNYT